MWFHPLLACYSFLWVGTIYIAQLIFIGNKDNDFLFVFFIVYVATVLERRIPGCAVLAWEVGSVLHSKIIFRLTHSGNTKAKR